jgi:hypothetical protein
VLGLVVPTVPSSAARSRCRPLPLLAGADHLVAGLLDHGGQQVEIDRVGQGHPSAPGGEVDLGRGHAGLTLQGALHPGAARAAGHALDGEIDGRAAVLVRFLRSIDMVLSSDCLRAIP